MSAKCQKRTSAASLDHLVGNQQKIASNAQVKCSGRFQIDDQLEFSRLLDWQVGRLGPFDYLVHVGGTASKQVGDARSVGHEPAEFYKLSGHRHLGQPMLRGEVNDTSSFSEEHRAGEYHKSVRARFNNGRECSVELIGALHRN
jgi:hypothetical protein